VSILAATTLEKRSQTANRLVIFDNYEKGDMMKKRKLSVLAISVCIVALMVVGLSSVTVCAQSKKILWRLNSWMPPPKTEHGQLQFACDEVYKRSNGQLKIEIFPLFSLGLSPTTWLRDMSKGALDISIIYDPYVAGEEPSLTVAEMPYIYKTREQSLMAIDALFPFRKRVYKEVYNSELIATGTLITHTSYLGTKGKQVKTLDDVKGLKLRTWGARQEEIWHRLGVAPQAMTLGESYMALKTGVVDGVLTGADAFFAVKLHEVLDYAVPVPSEMAHCQDIVVSNRAWKALPDDLKKIVNDVFHIWSIGSKGRAGEFGSPEDLFWRKRCEVQGNMVFSDLPKEDMDKISEVAWEVFLEWIEETGGRTLEAWALLKPILVPPAKPGVPENYLEMYNKTIAAGR